MTERRRIQICFSSKFSNSLQYSSILGILVQHNLRNPFKYIIFLTLITHSYGATACRQHSISCHLILQYLIFKFKLYFNRKYITCMHKSFRLDTVYMYVWCEIGIKSMCDTRIIKSLFIRWLCVCTGTIIQLPHHMNWTFTDILKAINWNRFTCIYICNY